MGGFYERTDNGDGTYSQLAKLTGRNVVITNLANNAQIRDTASHYFPGNGSSYVTSTMQDVSIYADKGILISNGHDQAITISFITDVVKNPTASTNRATLVSESLAAGTTKLYSVKDYPILKEPLAYLNVFAQSVTTAPTSGGISVNLLGGPR